MSDEVTPTPTAAGTDPADRYPSINVLVAGLLTFFAPFISLLAALALRNDQRNPARREQLKNWAIGSGVWLGLGVVILVIAVVSITSAGGGSCQGGINRLVPPQYNSPDGTHWVVQYQCMNGGTLTKPTHAKWLNK
ncbi:MAG: hypothetical protein ACR2KG_11275 [Nocardioidaceae bacterium]